MVDYSASFQFSIMRIINRLANEHPFPGFLRMQLFLAKMLLPQPKTQCMIPTIHGYKLIINPQIDAGVSIRGSVDRYLYYLGTYEIATLDIIKKILRKNSIIIDAGAYVGDTTIFMASIASEGTVVAFEPSPKLFEILSKNIALNHINNVHLYQCALGSQSGTKELFPHLQRMAMGSLNKQANHEYGPPINVAVKTIDEVLEGQRINEKIDLIKIDVEGYECEVLKGAAATIQKSKPALIIEHDPKGSNSRDVFEYISHMGIYNLYIPKHGRHHISQLVNILEYRDLPANEVTNIIAVEKDSKI